MLCEMGSYISIINQQFHISGIHKRPDWKPPSPICLNLYVCIYLCEREEEKGGRELSFGSSKESPKSPHTFNLLECTLLSIKIYRSTQLHCVL